MCIAYVALVLMNVIDCLYTAHALYIGSEEANPLVLWILERSGMEGVFITKFGFLALLGFTIPFMHLEHHRNVRWLFYFAVAAYTVLTAYHVAWYYWTL